MERFDSPTFAPSWGKDEPNGGSRPSTPWVRPGLAALLALAGSGVLKAQVASQEDYAAELLKVLNAPVEGASKRAQKAIESPQAVEVITLEQIRSSGAFRLADVLRLSTSLQVWDMDGERANVTLRGVSPAGIGATVQILLDGVPLYNVVAQPIDINGLPVPIDAIEKIEIVRGPSSSLYGANAQMGVIAITTRKASAGERGSIRFGAAEGGRFREEGFYALQEGRLGLVAAMAGYSDRNAGQPMDVLDRPGVKLPFRDAGHGSQVFLRPEVALGDAGKVWVAYGQGDAGHYDQVANDSATLAPLATFTGMETTREILQGGWQQTWSPVLSTDLQVDQKTFNFKLGPLATMPGNPASAAAVAWVENVDPALGTKHDFCHDRIQRVSFQANWAPTGAVHLVGGMDASHIDVGANQILGLKAPATYSASGGFLSLDWTLGPVTLSGGARAANESLGGTTTSPRFSAVWALDATTVLRAGYFTSTRSPMAQEKYSSIPANPIIPYVLLQNPNLRPEKVKDYEVGFRKHWNSVTLDVTAFMSDFNQVILLHPLGSGSPGVTDLAFQNSTRTNTDTGLEVAMTAELDQGLLAGWNASTARFKDPINNLDQQADYSSKGQGSVWLRFQRGLYFGYVAVQETGSYTVAVPGGQDHPSIPASTQIHFNVGLTPAQNLSLSLYGVNAFKKTENVNNMGTLNENAMRYTRREVGVQASLRF